MPIKTVTKREAAVVPGLSEWVVKDFIKNGYPRLGIKRPTLATDRNSQGGRRYRIPWSPLERIAKHRLAANQLPSDDIIDVLQAVRDFGFAPASLYRWCDTCLFLGRSLTHEFRDCQRASGRISPDVLHVSRKDLQMIRRMLEQPFGWKLPRNRGVWLANGLYQDTEGLWFTPRRLASLHQVNYRQWEKWVLTGHPAFPLDENHGKPRSQQVYWPSQKNTHDGNVLLIHETAANRILDWRRISTPTGQLPGHNGAWLSEDVYRQADGSLWAMDKWIQRSRGKSTGYARHWHKKGFLPKKWVSRPCVTPGIHGRVKVFSVDALNDLERAGASDPSASSKTATPKTAVAPQKTHKHFAEDKHRTWAQWNREEGLSYQQIVIRHFDLTGERVTRSAVIMALRRLRAE
jgi:hypothetical protein